jgi:hypothetical protein
MSQSQLENKVADYLRDSLALEGYGQSITAEQLQTEMDRMARNTKQPEVLRELFEALRNDPSVIAECLARPVVKERSVAALSAQQRTSRAQSAQTKELHSMSLAKTFGNVTYTLPKISQADPSCIDDTYSTAAPVTFKFAQSVGRYKPPFSNSTNAASFHPRAQQNAFRRRGARQQCRSFSRWKQSLRHNPNSYAALAIGCY